MTALIEIPFLYDMQYIPTGCRKPVTATVVGRTPVHLPEFSGREVPVAARIVSGNAFPEHFSQCEPFTMEYRRVNGALSKPYSAGMIVPGRENFPHREIIGITETQSDLDLSVANPAALMVREPWSMQVRTSLPTVPFRTSTESATLREELSIRTEIWSNRDNAAAAVAEAYRRAGCFIDGVLHIPSHGPSIVVEMVAGTVYLTAWPEYGNRMKTGPLTTFAGHDANFAVAHAARLIRRAKQQNYAVADKPIWNGQFVADAVALRDAASATSQDMAYHTAVRRAAGEMIDLVAPLIGSMDSQAIQEFGNIKAGYEMGMDWVAQLAHHISSFVSRWGSECVHPGTEIRPSEMIRIYTRLAYGEGDGHPSESPDFSSEAFLPP